MNQSEKIKIAVRFYRELRGILAIFPNDTNNTNGYRTDLIGCYSHTGQHSYAAPEYIKGLKPATKEEYKDLASELEGQGYDLKILNKE